MPIWLWKCPRYAFLILFPLTSQSLFLDKDHLNNRYFYKRAYYLAMLAAAVKQAEFPCEMKFAYLNNDQRRPILVLSAKKGKKPSEN